MKDRLERFFHWADSRLNPVLVKEVRQAVRSRFVLGVFLALLVIFSLVALFVSWFTATNLMSTEGKLFFFWVYGVLAVAVLFFVPAYSGFRIGFERSGQDPDLLFISCLKPGSIIRGKILVAAVLILFFISTGLPFVAFAYQLRGIDIPTVLAILSITGLVGVAASAAAILVGTIPSNKVGRIVLLLIALYGLAVLTFCAVIAVVKIMDIGGIGMFFGGATMSSWAVAFWILLPAGLLLWLCHSFSAALISPPPSNRILPIRISITACWLIISAGFITSYFIYSNTDFLYVWLTVTLFLFIFILLIAIGEREAPGPRVAKTIPHNDLLKIGALLFYSGSAGGIAWAFAIAVPALLASLYWFDSAGDMDEWTTFATLFLYSYAYCMTALLLRRTLFKNLIQPAQTWGLALTLVSLVTLVTFFVTDIIFHSAGLDIELPYGNIAKYLQETDQIDHTLFALAWAILATILWYPCGMRQVVNFFHARNNLETSRS